MTYLLDTNVVSVTASNQPDQKALAWIQSYSNECTLSCVTFGEIWKGIQLMPEGKRKKAVAAWASRLERDFASICLPLDMTILKESGKLCGKHQAKGLNLGVLDSLIAAMAIVHGLTVVTRNTGDFPPEVKTLNPWLA
jgi:predicted nucleic acid-binding protein